MNSIISWVGRLNNLTQRYDNGCEYAEVLISNYDTGERVRDMPSQMNLFNADLFSANNVDPTEGLI